jgi:hypothetical protein
MERGGSMIEASEIASTVQRMWTLHMDEMGKFDNIHEYLKGRRGFPSLPEGADGEVLAIRDNCVHNVLTLVLDAFVQNLSVVGYRNSESEANAEGWDVWQANQMDARQAEIYSSAVKYGVAYVVAAPVDGEVKFKIRSPRQLIAVYEDPQSDLWPQYALETWVDESNAKPSRKGVFYDATHMYELDLGTLATPIRDGDETVRRNIVSLGGDSVKPGVPHGAKFKGQPVCPVIRYVNRRDAEDLVEGEIERLLSDQRTINEVNFDRLIVARFGAFPQKVISGWSGTKSEVLEASARRVWAFDDEQVKAWTLQPASLDPYNALIQDLKEHVATRAQVSPASVVGKMVNLSAEALAAAEANQQRKLDAMRESHGESNEQLLALSQEMAGGNVDEAAETVWKDTEARSAAAIIDGIVKIGQALQQGFPIEPMLPLVPGLTQQMINAMAKKASSSTVKDLVASLRPAAVQAKQNPEVNALSSKTTPETPPAA